jgi:hypothetical protein
MSTDAAQIRKTERRTHSPTGVERRTHSPTGVERRRGPDRRKSPALLSDWKWALRGRRRHERRRGDVGRVHLDRYEPILLFLAVGILLLSSMDAAFTLALLKRGAVEEANPLMRFLIEHDVQVFINVKSVLTATGLVFMVICSRMALLKRVRVRRIMQGIFALYLSLIVYELVLLRITGGA